MRITMKTLESCVESINKLTQVSEDTLYELDHNGGGYRIMQKIGTNRGMRDVSPRLSASELYEWACGCISGLDIAAAIATRKDEYQAQQDYARNYGE